MKNALLFHHGHHGNPKRWISLLAVIVLHLAAIAWMTGYRGLTVNRQAEPDGAGGSISVSLHAAAAAITPAPPLQPEASAAENEPALAEADAQSMPSSLAAESPASPNNASLAGMEAPGASVEMPMQKDEQPHADATSWASSQASPPPSARLAYRIQAQRQGQKVFGSGQMTWRNNGNSYAVEGESSLLFFTVLRFRSEGTIDDKHGIAPTVYNEKRFRKSETNTHFHRGRKLVSFSASTRTYPSQGGEQDRSSVVWQLAGIGRHGSQQFRPGVQFALFVAGARDAETWYFTVVGLEEIDTDLGKMKAWHLERKPRANSYDQSVDVWLAPEKEWYPVKLRHTDKNGEYLDMTVSEIMVPAI